MSFIVYYIGSLVCAVRSANSPALHRNTTSELTPRPDGIVIAMADASDRSTESKPKRKKPIKTSALTKKNLESRGWIIDKCEQRLAIPPMKGGKPNPFANVTRDLFGMFDFIGIAPIAERIETFQRIVGIQVTSNQGGNHAARRQKILDNPIHKKWKEAGGLILIHSWAKQGPRGQEKIMTLREEFV